MAFGSELSYAALGLSSGSFSLAGIHLEEVLGAGLQVFQMDTVILGFRLVIIGISRFRGLGEIIGVRSISNNAAAPGVGGPGDDRPSRAGTLDARTISDLNCLRFWSMLWCRCGVNGQSRC